MKFLHILVVDGDQPHGAEPFTLHTVVHDITQTIEPGTLGQLFFGFLDGGGHSEAETAAFIYFYLNHYTLFF